VGWCVHCGVDWARWEWLGGTYWFVALMLAPIAGSLSMSSTGPSIIAMRRGVKPFCGGKAEVGGQQRGRRCAAVSGHERMRGAAAGRVRWYGYEHG
jgi:hypothetical protein